MYGCQKNPADCVMVMLEFCNDEKVIFAVLYLQPLGHPYSVVIN